MLLAKIENGRSTLLVEFPCKRMMLAEHLASIGISKPASQIQCGDEDGNPIKVKIYGEVHLMEHLIINSPQEKML